MEFPSFRFDGLKKDFESATTSSIREDLFAGLQVALITLPQSMAYAVVAGLPVSSGIFAALFSSLIALFFTSSRVFIVGPVNTLAVLIQASEVDILNNHFPMLHESAREYFALYITVQISLLIALFQILAALFQFGKLTRFISHSVTVGFLLGSLLALILGQLFSFVGLPFPDDAESLFQKGVVFFSEVQNFHLPTLIIGLITLSLLLIFRKAGPKLPWALFSFCCVVFLLSLFRHVIPGIDWSGITLVTPSEELSALIPTINFPWLDMRLLNSMLPLAFACALLSSLEMAMIAETVEAKTGDKANINQELLSVGFANIASSFFQAIPVSVSSSRTFFNVEARAKSRLSGLFNVLFVGIFATVFGKTIEWIPVAALSALMILTSLSLVRKRPLFICFNATRYDRCVLVATFVACLFFSLDLAFYIGVVLSITSYLAKAAEPMIHQFAPNNRGEIDPLSPSEAVKGREIRIVKVEGELFFASAKALGEGVRSIAEIDSTTKVLILQLKNGRDIDATGALALLETYETLKKRGCALLLAGVTYSLWEVICYSGLVKEIGKENIFLFDDKKPLSCLQRALARARLLVKVAEPTSDPSELGENDTVPLTSSLSTAP